jgi:hypothetical protein
LEKAGEFVPFEMLEAIPDPEKTTIAAIDHSLDDSFCAIEAEAIEDHDPLALQADYIPLDAGDIMEWNYLDADDDADWAILNKLYIL